MSDERPDDMDDIERIASDALHARADQIEPSPDAYARLADKVTGATRRPAPWWQSPRLLWLGAAGATAAAIAIALVVTFTSDDGSEVATAVTTETPTPVVEPTAGPVLSPTPGPTEAAQSVTPTPTPTLHPTTTPTPIGGGADRNQGRPEGVVWPVDAIQPFGEWPTTPEDAAQQFVQQLGGWTLPVGDVTFLEPILMIADVRLQFTDESGEPFGTSTTVRVVGGFDDQGVANWGAVWAISDFIEIDRSFFDGDQFLVGGAGLGFEGVIESRLVDPNGNVAGEGFFTAGGVEMAPIEGTVPLTENWPGPGFALLYDLGGLGITPSSLTIIPVVLPEIDQPDPGSGTCSAEGLAFPAVETVELADFGDPDVDATWVAIMDAAMACDYDRLAEIAGSEFQYSFGETGDPAQFWRNAEAAGEEPMRFLVETLWLPHAQPGADGAIPYVWPEVFVLPWEDVTDAQRSRLRDLYDLDDFATFDIVDGFIGYRLAIDEQGNWLYFLAGD